MLGSGGNVVAAAATAISWVPSTSTSGNRSQPLIFGDERQPEVGYHPSTHDSSGLTQANALMSRWSGGGVVSGDSRGLGSGSSQQVAAVAAAAAGLERPVVCRLLERTESARRAGLLTLRREASTWRRSLDSISSDFVCAVEKRRGRLRLSIKSFGGPLGGGRMELQVCMRRWPHDLDSCPVPGCRAMALKCGTSATSGKSEAHSAEATERRESGGGSGNGNAVAHDDEELRRNGGDPVPLSSSVKPPRVDEAAAGAGSTQSWPRLRVGYQGVPGAYSEAAALQAYPNCEAVPCDQFDATFQAVEQWAVERAVLPIENSLGGSIHRNYDLLLRHRLHIVGEVLLEVHHCLLALPGVKMEDIKKVVSHPQALAQCERTLTSLFSAGIVREAVDDTAGAGKLVQQENLRDTAAIASCLAGEIYGLSVLADGIQDDADNITRFIVLAREPLIPHIGGDYKTSIVFTLEEGPGVLFKALAAFALRGINLTKIESRPQRSKSIRFLHDQHLNNGESSSGMVSVSDWAAGGGMGKGGHAHRAFDYLFYVDFQASMAEPRAQNALRNLEEFAPFLRVLGSYPASS